MTKDELCAATIASALRECESHVAKLRRSRRLLSEFFPLKADGFERCSEEQVEHVDQFIYRFTKLQDAMGMRLLPSLHALLEGSVSPIPFLDVLNKLEKLQVLPSVEEWQWFGNLRNNLAHDYPESIEQTVLTLNFLFERHEQLLAMFEHVAGYAQRVLGIECNNGIVAR
ncbi:MAG: hypothetical protein EOL87_16020 [Spartobacteria bacterium]|nr:hypothetical protein [Spartobacteria bacterium]